MQAAIEVLQGELFRRQGSLKRLKEEKELRIVQLVNIYIDTKAEEGVIYRIEQDLHELYRIDKEKQYSMKDTCNELRPSNTQTTSRTGETKEEDRPKERSKFTDGGNIQKG
jgi:hypothetical protein